MPTGVTTHETPGFGEFTHWHPYNSSFPYKRINRTWRSIAVMMTTAPWSTLRARSGDAPIAAGLPERLRFVAAARVSEGRVVSWPGGHSRNNGPRVPRQ